MTALAASCLAFIGLVPAFALEPPVAIRPSWGVLIESLLDSSAYSAIPSPSLSFNFGSGVVMPLSPDSRLSFEPSADIYYFNAEYYNKRAVPTGSTFGSAFVLCLLLDAPIVYSIPVGQKITLAAGAGLSLDLRVAFNDDPEKTRDTPLINGYLWDKGRFITPSALLRGEYALTDRVGFGFTGRILLPVYNLWAGEGYGFFDHGIYLVDLTILYKLKASGG